MLFDFFHRGGPVMWPLLLTSIIALAVVVERLLFILKENRLRNPQAVQTILTHVEKGNIPAAIQEGEGSEDFVAKTLTYALTHNETSFSNALLLAANQALQPFNRGLAVLDTIITLAPLLGLFGTVTGMIHAFGLLGNKGLEAPTVITGGIAEALIATAFGLVIAIISLIPFNYLTNRLEIARREIEDAATYLELIILKQ
ncbi:MAG: MotA/TolQ/ExbB proton channel family protein [Candidatus Margulisiibacteriota bacterium]